MLFHLEAGPRTGVQHEDVIIERQPVPLHQHIEGRHQVGQASLQRGGHTIWDFFQMADRG